MGDWDTHTNNWYTEQKVTNILRDKSRPLLESIDESLSLWEGEMEEVEKTAGEKTWRQEYRRKPVGVGFPKTRKLGAQEGQEHKLGQKQRWGSDYGMSCMSS